jgi:hypothetical protein
MSDPTYIACPRCGERSAMTAMQKRLFHGRTLTCQRCAKPFTVTEETPDPVPMPAFHVPETPGTSTAAAEPPKLSPHQLAPPRSREGITAGRVALILSAAVVLLIVTLYLVIAPSVHRSRERARQAACQTNLIQIGMSLQAIAASNGGRFPDSLEHLVGVGYLPAELLVCPSTGTSNYVYLGKGLTTSAKNQPLAYEPLSNHGNAGTHVLYVDGTVQLLSGNAAIQALPQLAGPATSQAVK